MDTYPGWAVATTVLATEAPSAEAVGARDESGCRWLSTIQSFTTRGEGIGRPRQCKTPSARNSSTPAPTLLSFGQPPDTSNTLTQEYGCGLCLWIPPFLPHGQQAIPKCRCGQADPDIHHIVRECPALLPWSTVERHTGSPDPPSWRAIIIGSRNRSNWAVVSTINRLFAWIRWCQAWDTETEQNEIEIKFLYRWHHLLKIETLALISGQRRMATRIREDIRQQWLHLATSQNWTLSH